MTRMLRTTAVFTATAVALALSAVLTAVSCTSSDVSDRAVAADGNALVDAVTIPADGEDNTADHIDDGEIYRTPGPPADPLAEVMALWSSGAVGEARDRFWREDCRKLADGLRADEWALWRGRLYMTRWTGGELGLAGENVSSILADGDDVWAGTWTGGIVRYSIPLGSAKVWDPGLPSLAVRTVNRFRRTGGKISIVRYGAVEEYSPVDSTWDTMSGLPASERLQDIAADGDSMLMATLGDGLWTKKGREWGRVPEPGLFINRIEATDDASYIICTMDRGLFFGNGREWRRPEDDGLRNTNVTSALADGSRIIGGTYGRGGFVWDTVSGKSEAISELGDENSWIMDVERSGDWIYFATFGSGIMAWNTESGKWDAVTVAEGLPTADVAALERDADGNIWAGTLGGGLVRIAVGYHGE